MDTWANGAMGSSVKQIIDKNFDVLDKRTTGINERMSMFNPVCIDFVASKWYFYEDLNIYVISIPYEDYGKTNPCVDVYIKNKDGYTLVYGGYIIGEDGIKLQSDMPYEGKVVIR